MSKVFCLIFLVLNGLSQIAMAEINEEEIQSLLNNLTTQGHEGGTPYPDAAVLVYKNGESYFYNAGTGVIQENSIVEIASNTKVFSGILFSKMIFDEKVELTSTVNQLLGHNLMPVDVSLLDLATHSSGLPKLSDNLENIQTNDPYKGYNQTLLEDYMGRVQPRPLIPDSCEKDTADSIGVLKRPSRQCYNYSNVGFAILGYTLASVGGMSYEDLLDQYILKPLNLRDTNFSMSEDQKRRLVQGYNSEGLPTPKWSWGAMNPMGGLVSTPRDMLNFLIANLGEDETLAFAQTRKSSINRMNVGLGWHLPGQDDSVSAHSGGTYGFTSYMGVHKESNSAVFLVLNSYKISDPRPSLYGERILLMNQ